MFHVRKMSTEDFEFAVRLTDTMNWGSGEEDFKFMMKLEPNGCLILLYNSERVGIATAISYGRVGWIGNVIVSESRRGKGGGSLLVEHGIQYLTRIGVETVGLYSYLDRIPFYERHNFQSDSRFVVLKGRGFPASIKAHIRKAAKADLRQIIDLDLQYFGGSRSKLLKPVIQDPSNLCHVYAEDDKILGFAAAKMFYDVSEIGPLVCREGYENVALDLLKTIFHELKGSEVSLCVPEKESKILGLLAQHGFKENFRLARMFHGPSAVSNHIYVAESLERG